MEFGELLVEGISLNVDNVDVDKLFDDELSPEGLG
jgi:hypothetical protein